MVSGSCAHEYRIILFKIRIFMYKKFFVHCINFMLCCGCTSAQNSYNFDFETLSPAGLPDGINSNQQKTYSLSVDSLIRQHGKYSVVLEQKDPNAQFGAFSFSIKPTFS